MRPIAPLLYYLAVVSFCAACIAIPSCGGVDCKDAKNASGAECVAKDVVVDCTTQSAKDFVAKELPELWHKSVSASGVDWSGVENSLIAFAKDDGLCVLEAFTGRLLNSQPVNAGGSGSGSAGSDNVAKAAAPTSEVINAKKLEIEGRVYPHRKVLK